MEGYRKFPKGFFQIKLYPFGPITVLTDQRLINELRNAPDEFLDFTGGIARTIQPKYTLSPILTETGHHLPTIRTTLTRNLAILFEDIVDEMKASFEENIDVKGSEWIAVPAHSTMMDIVSRISNRVIVGLPHCRNKEYCKLNVGFVIDVVQTGRKINRFPDFLHPIIGPYYSIVKSYQQRMLSIIGPTIKQRREMLDRYGSEWADKPNDYLTWTMEEDTGPLARDPGYLALRILQVNFAAIHTSSRTFTHALYTLALHPEWTSSLRDESFRIIKQEGGWTKAAMREMKMGDSFLRESARVNSLNLLILTRLALKSYTFSNGLTIPKGNYVTTSSYSIHQDDGKYAEANEFKPWRFVDENHPADKEKGGPNAAKQYVETGPDYLAFGYGKHACPGRFFAANELKAMLCYVVMNYDIKLEGGETVRPENLYVGSTVSPNPAAKVMFRKRTQRE